MTDRELVFALTGLFNNDVELVVAALIFLDRDIPFEKFNLYYKEMNDMVKSLDALLDELPAEDSND